MTDLGTETSLAPAVARDRRVRDSVSNLRRPPVVIAFLAGLYGVAWVLEPTLRVPHALTDFDHVWYAARALRLGLDPYAVIGPGKSFFAFEWPLFYPVTAMLLVWPLALLPLLVARALFIGIPSAFLGYGLARDGRYGRLLLFLSPAYVTCAQTAQWSILNAAAVVVPWLAFTFVAKPNIGVALMPAIRLRWWRPAALIAAVFVVGSFAIQPGWFSEWRAVLANGNHFRAYVALPGGFLLLLAALRWRRPEARMLLGLAIVPQSTIIYGAVPLLLVADTRREMLLLVTCSATAYVIQLVFVHPTGTTPEFQARLGIVVLWALYLPALVLILRRPNIAR